MIVPRSHTFHSLSNQSPDHVQEEDGSPEQRRITIASYTPQSKDQNGNFPEKDSDRQGAKPLGEFNTEEVCQWFSSIGLHKCLTYIREAELCGTDIASIDLTTLEVLHISSLEEREQLLSAVYRELHPPSTTSRKLDSLLETFGPNNIQKFTAALVTMSQSKSSQRVSCLNMNQKKSFKFRCKSPNPMNQRTSLLMEITIHASVQIVHLRTPRETTVGKVMESCLRMLGMTEDKELFSLTDKPASSEELSSDQQIVDLASSENKYLELYLCKKEKPKSVVQPQSPAPTFNGSLGNGPVNQTRQVQVVSQPGKEEKICELNEQVDSLQNVILQVQEIHHGLVAFCSELKRMDGEVDASGLRSPELEQRLGLALGLLRDKRHGLQSLRESMRDTASHRNKRSEVRLLDKMKLNCQVFKEEISLVHLNRQVAHLQQALQDSQDKERSLQSQSHQRKCSTLGQLVTPQCPAMLLVVQESRGEDGRYGFTFKLSKDRGLVVIQVDNSHSPLCLEDRLVEVNGVPVVDHSEHELSTLLLLGPSAQIVVLRRPPPPGTQCSDSGSEETSSSWDPVLR
ncbi:uncharacterized protein [Salmo salar]|uniref:SAM domain-containing protein n=1 Tax=Salmo salar TaxID=8030 RepID=A0ABM3DHG3_SALSA|nr:uncharacterized protein LOC106591840 [Salmo salar]|eukprot:XP_014038585.1 PREDICTED: uncharacterized protein LOC106591840 [Salmo salar]